MEKIDILAGKLDTWLAKHKDEIFEVKKEADTSKPLNLSLDSARDLGFLFCHLCVHESDDLTMGTRLHAAGKDHGGF